MIRRTDRLLLREFVESDWPAVLEYQSDPRYLRYYPWTERTPEDVRAFIRMFIDWQREEPRRKYQFAVLLPAENRLIGNCGLRKKTADAWEAEIGYEFAPAWWGQGFATEAAGGLLAFGFEELRLHRIWAYCVAENVASARVLEKIGMRREGRLHENEWMKGRWWDTLLYGILEHEWRAQVR
ncbi:MAG: GNAT family N-acetyltransferase [Ardenticatenaceae bacterium]|nr:GNAT family N-acetyltransferase [Ardenticatenaceae bacterium]